MEEIFLKPEDHFLIRSSFLLPFPHPPLYNGAIEVKGLKVQRVGPYRELKKEVAKAKFIDLEDLWILPVFTNSHTHLELSALRFRVPPSGNFVYWVRSVIKKRAQLSPMEIKESVRLALQELLKEGIGVLGEVTNSALSIDVLLLSPLSGYIFQEVINFKGGEKLKERPFSSFFLNPSFKITYAPHSPYTVSPLLLQVIKAYNRKRGSLFCIHLAESQEEIEFLKTGEGLMAELLKERGQWNESFQAPGVSPVKYLDSLGCLDEKTLIIHGVYLDEEDLELLSKRRAKVCLCPRSNLYTGVGLPNLPKLLSYEIELCLGTDSLASNDKLSILEEIKTLYSFYPEVSPLKILEIATSGGAKILGFEERGSLSSGSYANFIGIETNFSLSKRVEKDLSEFIFAEKRIKYRFYAG